MPESPENCPKCGAEIPRSNRGDLCPKCLMDAAALSQTVDPDETVADEKKHERLPVPGEQFGGYLIQGFLGRGGMGAVYEAEEISSGRRVALKVLSHRLDSDEARNRFLREGRLAASINHPNSVYVFGTEEIDGIPAISMELVPAGTLQERVKGGGPLDVAEAVDIVLQIISGLDAAQKVGILHRDVKPSNCFTDGSGVAKIGDFGLSISTEGRDESHFTVEGTLLGTPAFSSPEQLRGDVLNARSDMYSVGATLYYLLTGNAPFEESNMVKLLSRVLEEQAPSIREARAGIPKGLAGIISKCLQKAPGDRFKSYAHLSKALRPFGSASPTPATLALRLVAYGIDSVIVGLAGFVVQLIWWGGNFGAIVDPNRMFTPAHMGVMGIVTVMSALYLALFEGWRGATPGKALTKLSVVQVDGRPVTYWRALVRVAILFSIQGLPFWVFFFLASSNDERISSLTSSGLGLLNAAMIVVTFSTARRRNGYAGIHELWSGTRVAHSPAVKPRPRIESGRPEAADRSSSATEFIGPYGVLEHIGEDETGTWALGYDSKLMRKVWIHQCPAETPPVSDVQRNLSRRGRLRWISGKRFAEENWDVFEALDGQPLLSVERSSTNWDSIRFWLLDLTEELQAATSDDTLPPTLGLDRVWITADGNARILDFRCPGLNVESESLSPAELLGEVSGRAEPVAIPLPLHARNLVTGLRDQGLGFDEILTILRKSVRRPVAISRLRRLALAFAACVAPAISVLFLVSVGATYSSFHEQHPRVREVGSVARFALRQSDAEDRDALRRLIAHDYQDVFADPKAWGSWGMQMTVEPRLRAFIEKAIVDFPNLAENDAIAGRILVAPELERTMAVPGSPFTLGSGAVVLWIVYGALPALLAALIARGGLLALAVGASVVANSGSRASRLHVALRAIVAWTPICVISFLCGHLLEPPLGSNGALAVGALISMLLVISSCALKGRGLQDRIAGTWLVPK